MLFSKNENLIGNVSCFVALLINDFSIAFHAYCKYFLYHATHHNQHNLIILSEYELIRCYWFSTFA